MLKGRCVLIIVTVCILISPYFFAVSKAFSQTTQEALHAQGLERAIVIFEEAVDLALIEQYDGIIIRELKTLNCVICILPQENLDVLKSEPSIKDVVPDVILQIQSGYGNKDPEEVAERERLKNEYFQSIRDTYYEKVSEVRQEYIRALMDYRERYSRVTQSYTYVYNLYLECADPSFKEYLQWVLGRYVQLLQYLSVRYRNSYYTYFYAVTDARDAYFHAASEWAIRVDDLITLAYSGPLTPKWNTLESGCNATAAWDNYDLDGTGVKIAFLDTGIDYEMENLDDNYLGGYDFVNSDDQPLPARDGSENHGTWVASLAVGEGIVRVIGVAYNASYYVVKVVPNDGGGGWLSDFLSGIEWASQEPHKADIISMSLVHYGGGMFWQAYGPLIREACDNAYASGIILIGCSGNEGYDYSAYPAAFPNIVAVGAHAENQALWDDAWGKSNGGCDVLAPGAHVYTAGADDSGYYVWGTSAATPHVSGLAALMLQFARERGIEINNGYAWETIKHGAIDLGIDPLWQGEGKICAANTTEAENPKGACDLMIASIWPFDYTFEYYDYIFLKDGLYPAYYIGETMYQDITITNVSDVEGNTPEIIDSVNITTVQKYQDDGTDLPGNSTEDFAAHEPIALDPGDLITVPDEYDLPYECRPGLYDIELTFEFTFEGNSRIMRRTEPAVSTWCPPGTRPEE